MPSMTTTHTEGTLNVLNDQLIAIGGKNAISPNHGFVDIFNKSANIWVQGPALQQGRRVHSTVVVNQTALVVIGGYADDRGNIRSVQILRSEDMIWRPLPDLPLAAHALICGLVEVNEIVCFGGSTDSTRTFELNLSSVNSQWIQSPKYAPTQPLLYGSILRLRNELYCMSIMIKPLTPHKQLMKMNLTASTLSWTVVQVFSVDMFDKYGFYVTDGFTIKP